MPTTPAYGTSAPTIKEQERIYYENLQEAYRRVQNSSAADAARWANMHNNLGSQLSNIQVNNYTPVKKPPADPLDDHTSRLKMLGMRLRWEGDKIPYKTLHTHREGETIFVFLVVDGKPITLEDSAGLYPSDTLVTQLRLIEK